MIRSCNDDAPSESFVSLVPYMFLDDRQTMFLLAVQVQHSVDRCMLQYHGVVRAWLKCWEYSSYIVPAILFIHVQASMLRSTVRSRW